MRYENTLRLSGLRQWMKSEAERPECVPIDQMWDEVRSLSLSLALTEKTFTFQIADLVVKSILCGFASLKEEMNSGQKKEVTVIWHQMYFLYCSGEVDLQHVQAAWLRHPARLPPKTPPH